jgi:hypothetical protein
MTESPNPIEVELAAEKAAALGESGKRLRAALEKLRQFKGGAQDLQGRPDGSQAPARRELVELAGEAFWSYIVQREALGLYDEEEIARDYGVTDEVRNHMGPRIRSLRRP